MKKRAFTLVEIMIVVAIIGLLAAIAIPAFMRARTTSQQKGCLNNLRQIEAAKDQYALDYGLTNYAYIGLNEGGTTIDDVVGFSKLVAEKTEALIKTYPICPASTNIKYTPTAERAATDYLLNNVGYNAMCNKLSNAVPYAHNLDLDSEPNKPSSEP